MTRGNLVVDIAVAPGVTARMREQLEREGRRFGVGLDVLELIAQDAKTARAFLKAARENRVGAFLGDLDRTALERRLGRRERGDEDKGSNPAFRVS
ncbi:MAG: hypothetical protein ACYDCK_14365 [Thermoplasmatota archaeon]